MVYRENGKNGDKLSQLGFGCMRLPSNADKARELIQAAIRGGVNYFDTAYLYPGNEELLAKCLAGAGVERSAVKIATKMPLILMKKNDPFSKFFEKSLERLKADYVDYYLMHMFVSFEQYEDFVKRGFKEWAASEKASGRVKNMGFSFHGMQADFIKIVDDYDWDFCMIQYNYIDENHQAGTEGLKHAASKGMPVMVMEPLRGGKLAGALPSAAKAEFDKSGVTRSAAEWGLRWVWNHPEVTLLLSGMNEPRQLEENLRLANEAKADALTETELAAYERAKAVIRETTKVPCTGCGYCVPCPAGVDIPGCFSFYNETGVGGRVTSRNQLYIRYAVTNHIVPEKSALASVCKKCGKCETHCPQGIKIMEKLEETAKTLEPWWLKPVAGIARLFMRRK